MQTLNKLIINYDSFGRYLSAGMLCLPYMYRFPRRWLTAVGVDVVRRRARFSHAFPLLQISRFLFGWNHLAINDLAHSFTLRQGNRGHQLYVDICRILRTRNLIVQRRHVLSA